MVDKLPPRPRRATLDDKGREILDPVPMAPPVGYVAGMTQEERLKAMVRAEHARLRAEMFDETPEEANDFDIDDDPIDPSTPYEEHYEALDAEDRRLLRDDAFRRRFLEERRLALLAREMEERDGDTRSTAEGRENDPGRRSDDQGEVTRGRSGENEEPPVSTGVRAGAERAAPGAGKGAGR